MRSVGKPRTPLRLAGALLLIAIAPFAVAEGGDFSLRPMPEPASGRPVFDFLFLFGAPARWPGAIAWSYNPAGATAAFSSVSNAVSAIAAGADKWAAVCGVRFSYQGTTAVAPDTEVGGKPDLINVVGWSHLGGGVLGDTSAFYNRAGSAPYDMVDSDIALSMDLVNSNSDMDRVATHEWGHALGLAHSNLNNQVMSGTPDSQYNSLTNLQADDIRGCRCLYGMPAGQKQGYACSLPRNVDFGTVDIGTASDPQTVVFSNDGNAPLTILNYSLTAAGFSQPEGCTPGVSLSPGSSCTLTMLARPSLVGSQSGDLLIATDDGVYDLPLLAHGSMPAAPPPLPTVDVIEYYHAALDHYFMSSLAADILALDGGQSSGWQRTGRQFKAFPDASPGANPVCRFYLPPPFGDSHFYSASAAECTEVRQKYPGFDYESPNVMYLGVPDASGACAPGMIPVYRVWDKRIDTNHRYMTDRALRDQMVALGWVKEGYGDDAVIMCAPQ
jgi:Matrixin